ncbi:MAG: hypothetical protein J6A92_06930 [Lachnospiraceae bacterium]|nr:hypothetical protein [Lachnospiraceae bacterium]
MELLLQILLIIFMLVVGVLPCLYMLISMPAVIIWKIYRKIKYNISIND